MSKVSTYPQPFTVSAVDRIVVIAKHALPVDARAMSAAEGRLRFVLHEAFLHMLHSRAGVDLVAAGNTVH